MENLLLKDSISKITTYFSDFVTIYSIVLRRIYKHFYRCTHLERQKKKSLVEPYIDILGDESTKCTIKW